jgi:hypothetical protein
VNDWLAHASRWQLALITGIPFGVVMGVYAGVQSERWPVAVIGGALGGVIVGPVMGAFAYRQNRSVRETIGGAAVESRRRIVRAAWRGPVPDDPEDRAAAARLADHQRAQMRRTRTLSVGVFAVFLVLESYLAIARSPWFWLAAAFMAGMLALSLLTPRRLERRAERLRS